MSEYDLPISGQPPVTVPFATDLFVLARSGKTHRIAHSDLTAKALGSLVDVDLTGLSNGSFLVYNTASGKWVVASGVMRTSVYDQNGNGIVDQAEAVPWTGVTGKPVTFTPSAHTHDDRYFTESELSLAGGGGIVHWDNLIGVPTLAVGDMRKSVYDTDGDGIVNQAAVVLWSGVSGKPASFPPASHDHNDLYFTESELSTSGGGGQVHWNNITNKPTFTTGNMEKATYDVNNNGVVDAAESVPWTGVTGKPSAFTPSDHNHDDRYFTETELSTSGQATVHWVNLSNIPEAFPPSVHNHDERYYTEAELQGGTATVSYNCLTNLPASFAPAAHASSHQNGGSDQLNVTGLSGVLADAQNANKLNGRSVANIAPSDGQVLAWNEAENYFEPAEGGTGSGGGGHVIFDETTELAQRESLRFVGQNVLAEDDATNGDTIVKVSDWPMVKDALSEPLTIPEGRTLLVGPDFTVGEDLTIDGTLVVVGSGGSGGGAEVWNKDKNPWAFHSIDDPTGVCAVASDATLYLSVGMRIKLENGGNVIYGIITKIEYSDPVTMVTFLHEINPGSNQAQNLLQNSPIESAYFSSMRFPFGFSADFRRWALELVDSTQYPQASPVPLTYYNIGSLSLSIPIGLWDVRFGGYVVINGSTQNRHTFHATLSAQNNAPTHEELTSRADLTMLANNQIGFPFEKNHSVFLDAKTTFYVLVMSRTSGASNIFLGQQPTIVRAVCSYF